MAIRCSLLGHEFGEPTQEEDREERGNEVVVTVRELKECERCGRQSVISENTEVRSIEESSDAEVADPEPADDGAEEITADAADADDAEPADDGTEDGEFEPPESADEDDGVILDDDEGAGDTDQWPDEHEPAVAESPADDAVEAAGDATEAVDDAALERNGETEATDLTEWPDPGVEDEGFDAEPGSAGDVDVEFGGGLRPEAADADGDESGEFVSASGTGITSTGPVERTDQLDTVLVCPECEFGEQAISTSQRPGDICPDCRRGYLTERER